MCLTSTLYFLGEFISRVLSEPPGRSRYLQVRLTSFLVALQDVLTPVRHLLELPRLLVQHGLHQLEIGPHIVVVVTLVIVVVVRLKEVHNGLDEGHESLQVKADPSATWRTVGMGFFLLTVCPLPRPGVLLLELRDQAWDLLPLVVPLGETKEPAPRERDVNFQKKVDPARLLEVDEPLLAGGGRLEQCDEEGSHGAHEEQEKTVGEQRVVQVGVEKVVVIVQIPDHPDHHLHHGLRQGAEGGLFTQQQVEGEREDEDDHPEVHEALDVLLEEIDVESSEHGELWKLVDVVDEVQPGEEQSQDPALPRVHLPGTRTGQGTKNSTPFTITSTTPKLNTDEQVPRRISIGKRKATWKLTWRVPGTLGLLSLSWG